MTFKKHSRLYIFLLTLAIALIIIVGIILFKNYQRVNWSASWNEKILMADYCRQNKVDNYNLPTQKGEVVVIDENRNKYLFTKEEATNGYLAAQKDMKERLRQGQERSVAPVDAMIKNFKYWIENSKDAPLEIDASKTDYPFYDKEFYRSVSNSVGFSFAVENIIRNQLTDCHGTIYCGETPYKVKDLYLHRVGFHMAQGFGQSSSKLVCPDNREIYELEGWIE